MPAEETPGPIEVLIEERDGVLVVALAGELDIACASQVAAALDEAIAESGHEVAVDLSRLEYMDSTGLRTLLEARERAAARGRRLALLGVSARARRVIELTGADALLEIVEDIDELRPGGAEEAAPG